MPFKSQQAKLACARAFYHKRRKEWLEQHGPCVDCGSWIDLEIDHTNPTTKITHRVFLQSKARREAELAKCQPRCADCHLKKTAIERWGRLPAEHGTGGYARGCRCAECRAAHTAYSRAWREKRKLSL